MNNKMILEKINDKTDIKEKLSEQEKNSCDGKVTQKEITEAINKLKLNKKTWNLRSYCRVLQNILEFILNNYSKRTKGSI